MPQGNLDAINTLAKEISAAGRAAETAQVDALDEQAVASHLDAVVDKAGTVDISFNAIGIPQHGIQGIPLTGLASGSAVSRAGDWFGSPVNVASRVTGVARPGAVLVTESARDAIASADGFDWSVAGARHLKGVKGAAAVATIGGTAADIRGASDVVLWGFGCAMLSLVGALLLSLYKPDGRTRRARPVEAATRVPASQPH